MTQKTRMFKHSNGVRHKYKLKSKQYFKDDAARHKQYWKGKGYYVRVVKTWKGRKEVYNIWAFSLRD